MSIARTPSVALLTNAPAPYRTPLLNELARRCRLLVMFDLPREAGREWEVDESDFDFEARFLRSVSIPRRKRYGARPFLHVPLNVVPVLERFGSDVVVAGELGARTASAAAFCRLRKRPLVVQWEGTPHTEAGTTSLRASFRRRLLQNATRVWGNGAESARVLTSYGVQEDRIDLGMGGMDTLGWRVDVDDGRDKARASLRERYGLRGTVVLFAGALTPRKGVRELLRAFSVLAEDGDLPPWSALFVGSGHLDHDIRAWAADHPAVPVALSGFVPGPDLAQHFAAADLFVTPSLEDNWGLVCLEALLAGLPQVTSSFAGAAPELVTSPDIGAVVDPTDTSSLARELEHLIRAGTPRVPEEQRTRAMRTWSPEAFADRAMTSIHSAIQAR